ncbi:FxsA family protein [Roseovarius sp. 2305UL8-3]|uniref:FxsA family protein n=1 Tax=Roseovarius conchicola TaxID=3121636 RepID=UPI003527013C
MWLFLAFLAVPLIEIALFIQVGGLIGLWPTLGIVVLTAILGTFLVRTQGAMAMNNLRASFSRLEDPSEPLAHGAMILVSGALLLTPGFFTDAVGFALLMPPVRSAVFGYLRKRITVQRFDMGGHPQHPRHTPGDDSVIDAEYTEVDSPKSPSHRPSGWTKH